jgi:predicted aminopeptidase|tara:strand:+ start:3869 stop:4987 length:1119 start_codon:yes stop_codon:yes gene_type:complete
MYDTAAFMHVMVQRVKSWQTQLFLICISGVISGCSLPYYWQAIGGQLELLQNQVPIHQILESADTNESTKAALQQIVEARKFAIDELNLPDNGSYRTYVDLERSSVVWNVVATKEFVIDPKTWCFPFAGCVSYRGYFDESVANHFAERLKSDGLDTVVVGAAAYSTLGFFEDPILNTMIDIGGQNGASIIIHELAHQKLYVNDDSELNEAFATAVEEYGTELWLMRIGEENARTVYRERMKRRTDFSRLINDQQERLREIFSRPISDLEKRIEKRAAFELMREEYKVLKESWGGIADYDSWFNQPLNNAHLATIATYRRWVPGLLWLIDTQGLELFYREMELLRDLDLRERRKRMSLWAQEANNVVEAVGVL